MRPSESCWWAAGSRFITLRQGPRATIEVQCAGGDEEDAADASEAVEVIDANAAGADRAMQEAVRRSGETGKPVHVDFN